MSTAAPAKSGLTSLAPRRLQSDDALARAISGGDQRAFEVLYERYHGPLYRYCLSILRHPEDAEEALQAAMLNAYRSLSGGVRELAMKPWLYRIAHNECLRQMGRRPDWDGPMGLEAVVGGEVEGEAEVRDQMRQLKADLAALPVAQRSALVLRELSGLSHEAIAETLGETPATAKQLIYEARRSLQEFGEGRELACATVRHRLSDGDGRVLRSRQLKAHLRACAGCQEFKAGLTERRRQLVAIFPLLPAIAAERILGAILGAGSSGGAAALAGAGGAAGVVGGGAVAATSGGTTAAGVAGGAAGAEAAGAGAAAAGGGAAGGAAAGGAAAAAGGAAGGLLTKLAMIGAVAAIGAAALVPVVENNNSTPPAAQGPPAAPPAAPGSPTAPPSTTPEPPPPVSSEGGQGATGPGGSSTGNGVSPAPPPAPVAPPPAPPAPTEPPPITPPPTKTPGAEPPLVIPPVPTATPPEVVIPPATTAGGTTPPAPARIEVATSGGALNVPLPLPLPLDLGITVADLRVSVGSPGTSPPDFALEVPGLPVRIELDLTP